MLAICLDRIVRRHGKVAVLHGIGPGMAHKEFTVPVLMDWLPVPIDPGRPHTVGLAVAWHVRSIKPPRPDDPQRPASQSGDRCGPAP